MLLVVEDGQGIQDNYLYTNKSWHDSNLARFNMVSVMYADQIRDLNGNLSLRGSSLHSWNDFFLRLWFYLSSKALKSEGEGMGRRMQFWLGGEASTSSLQGCILRFSVLQLQSSWYDWPVQASMSWDLGSRGICLIVKWRSWSTFYGTW